MQIQATYEQLGLQTYFTTGKKETRAWTVLVSCNGSLRALCAYLVTSVDVLPHKLRVLFILTLNAVSLSKYK